MTHPAPGPYELRMPLLADYREAMRPIVEASEREKKREESKLKLLPPSKTRAA